MIVHRFLPPCSISSPSTSGGHHGWISVPSTESRSKMVRMRLTHNRFDDRMHANAVNNNGQGDGEFDSQINRFRSLWGRVTGGESSPSSSTPPGLSNPANPTRASSSSSASPTTNFRGQQQQQSGRMSGGVANLPEQDWGNTSAWDQDWDPMDGLSDEALESIAEQAESDFRRTPGRKDDVRDKWLTPLLDFKAVAGAIDPDQERSEDNLQGEALANKDESQRALKYITQLIGIPIVSGFVISRALADPVLAFTLQNNEEAFGLTELQEIEGARAVHVEESRIRMEAAIGKIPPLTDELMVERLREFAVEFEEEERHHNEQTLMTFVSDSISGIMLFSILAQESRGRQALFNTVGRLFEGLSDIAKAVAIILIADTLLGYHSEEGWTGLIEIVMGHYGFEADEAFVVIFVGVIPVVIDVWFKYWIFIGLNKISPGAVVTIKQVDTH